jgi:SpoVK/Ycf46/Vps4 family AAA+-type ATPase
MILTEKARLIRESGYLEYYDADNGWDQVGGLDLLKSYAQRALRSYEPEARAYGVEPKRGMLLVGLPGCGKSWSAKAITGGRMPLVRFDVSAIFGSLVGQSEAQMRDALRTIEAIGRCVLWIDEIEKALSTGGGESDGGTRLAVLGILLTWMEETESDAYIVATANNVDALPPELIRRFDARFFVDLPSRDERKEIAAIHLAKRDRDPAQFDLDAIADATDKFTGAEIEETIVEAIAAAYDAGDDDITTEHVCQEASLIVPLAETMRESISHMREWATRARAASSQQSAGIGRQSADALIEI